VRKSKPLSRVRYVNSCSIVRLCGLVSVPEQLQQVQEDHDDIHVDVECSKDVLFRAESELVLASNHDLSIIHQENREQHCSDSRKNELHRGSKEDGQKGEKEKHQRADKQRPSHHRKVILCLESEDGQSDANNGCDSGCQQNGTDLIVRSNESNDHAISEREEREKDEVVWTLSSKIFTAGHGKQQDNSNDVGTNHQTRILSYKSFDTVIQREKGNNTGGCK